MAIATIRYTVSVFTTAKVYQWFFVLASLIIAIVTYAGVASLLSLVGNTVQTLAAFNNDDRKLRQLMIIGTFFWMIHNMVIGSVMAVLMEIIFLCSNLTAYYRFYGKIVS